MFIFVQYFFLSLKCYSIFPIIYRFFIFILFSSFTMLYALNKYIIPSLFYLQAVHVKWWGGHDGLYDETFVYYSCAYNIMAFLNQTSLSFIISPSLLARYPLPYLHSASKMYESVYLCLHYTYYSLWYINVEYHTVRWLYV